MPNVSPILALDRILSKLTKEWHEHRDSLAKIEAVFSKYGIDPNNAHPVVTDAPVVPKATAAAAPIAKKGKRRRRLGVSGSEFVLGLLSGGKALTTAQASDEWAKANRPGKADQRSRHWSRARRSGESRSRTAEAASTRWHEITARGAASEDQILRVIAAVKVGGIEYQAIWASLSWIKPDDHKGSPALARTIRSSEGNDEAIIRRNASLADVQSSLRQLRVLGFGDSKLSQLFNHKGNPSRLAQHVKVLVASLK